ncbi:MAG: hypothetical protein VB084_09130 [Syntrophomonadaceae bacterium]|nr:hypothetical protein [Syntrophomonadaceae bacterium]
MNIKSIDELPMILKHIDYRFDFLMGVVYRKAVDECSGNKKRSTVLRSSVEIQNYLSRHEIDMIILTCPGHMPLVLAPTERGWVKHTEGLSDWITEHWQTELLIIALS